MAVSVVISTRSRPSISTISARLLCLDLRLRVGSRAALRGGCSCWILRPPAWRCVVLVTRAQLGHSQATALSTCRPPHATLFPCAVGVTCQRGWMSHTRSAAPCGQLYMKRASLFIPPMGTPCAGELLRRSRMVMRRTADCNITAVQVCSRVPHPPGAPIPTVMLGFEQMSSALVPSTAPYTYAPPNEARAS